MEVNVFSEPDSIHMYLCLLWRTNRALYCENAFDDRNIQMGFCRLLLDDEAVEHNIFRD